MFVWNSYRVQLTGWCMSDGLSIELKQEEEERQCEYNATYQVTYLTGEGKCSMLDVDTGLAFLVDANSLRSRLEAFFSEKARNSIEGKLFGGHSVKINFARMSASAAKSIKFDPLKVLARLTSIERLSSMTSSDDDYIKESDEELLYDLSGD